MLTGQNGIITNAAYAKFATEIQSLKEKINLEQSMSDTKYSGSINDLLNIDNSFNDKVLIEDNELKYINNNISSQEREWFEKLGITKSSDYYTIEFDTSGSPETISNQTIRAGKLASQPNDPQKEGYEFLGWFYLQEKGSGSNISYIETKFDFNQTISSNYSLYAKYSGEAILTERKNQSFFWIDDYRTKITDIYFKKGSLTIPSTSIINWNIRANNNCSDIIAYIEKNSDDTYSLTIISDKTIYSNISMISYFSDFVMLQKIDFSNFDTSKTHYMINLFQNCTNISELNLECFNMKNVSSMHGMFWNCTSLINLNISNFDTSNVSDMRYLFAGCNNLQEINLDNFDTSNVTTMRQMFQNCSKLRSLNLMSFNTEKVTDMAAMFQNCTNLNLISVGQYWNTDNVKDFSNMFLACGVNNVTKNS